MRRLVCKLRGHDWGRWIPPHGRSGYRERECKRCQIGQKHSIVSDVVTETR